ncbi:potassium channel family protein [Arcanobacterium buesumense]|uniref:Potassium channel family protein n=1 Tax=Arcanobacterium buesumense TaxID=2722751 RepID=A0A6H2EMT3_9ACTO|nr:potassium channel family protein [Arcanobacterium buesumense]QJC22377.1 potassium channel family protein [Arcanobacterium buesumense]
MNRVEKWERQSECPMVILALIFLVLYTWEVICEVTGPTRFTIDVVMNIIWGLFIADYAVRFVLATPKRPWFIRNLFDLAIVLLPLLRPLRLLRLLAFVKILGRKVSISFRGKIIVYAVSAVTMLVFISAIAVLDTERHAPGTMLASFGDALWWAFVTITTVGYGDLFPVTTTGRIIALLLMVGGIALTGIVTATLASWIVENVSEESEEHQAATKKEIAELRAEIRELKKLLVQETT